MSDPALLVAVPLLAAFLLPVAARVHAGLARLLGPAALLAQLALAVLLWRVVAAGGPVAVSLGGFTPPVGIGFYADALAMLFATGVPAFLLLLWPWREAAAPRELTLLLLVAGGAAGMALSGDLFNLFVFYEIVSVASFGLAAAPGSGAALAASLRYLILSAMASALALLGIGIVYALTGSLNLAHLSAVGPAELGGPLGITAFVLMLLGFGVKAELFPVNTWVPEVYAAASLRVAALLAGVVSKLALLLILRLLLLPYAGTEATTLLLAVGAVGLVLGELAAFQAADLRRMLAYSSIAQLSLAAVAFGVPGAGGVLAGLALAAHHMLVKPAMFLLCDGWSGSLDSLRGRGRAGHLHGALFVLLALSLIGVPPLPGFWAKYLTLKALVGTGDPLPLLAAGAILVMTVVEAAYLVAVVRRLFEAEPAKETHHERTHWASMTPAYLLGAAVIAAALTAAPLGRGLEAMAREAADAGRYLETVAPLRLTEAAP